MTVLSQPPLLDLPAPALAQAPSAGKLWWRAVVLAWVILGLFLLDRIARLLMDYWLFQSLQLESVFWTNFGMGAALFGIGILAGALTIGPAFLFPIHRRTRLMVVNIGLIVDVILSYRLAGRYFSFLMATGVDFGWTDPIFGKDAGFYTYTLPAVWEAWRFLYATALMSLASCVTCAWASRRRKGPLDPHDSAAPRQPAGLRRFVATVDAPATRVMFAAVGVLSAIGWWLGRYDVLFMDNDDRSIFGGASYVDVTGLFSTLNDYWFTAFVTLAVFALLIVAITRISRAAQGAAHLPVARLFAAIAVLIGADCAFKLAVSLRQLVAVGPDEPVIQLPYIAEHIQATRRGYDLERIETVNFVPKGMGDPLPDVDRLLRSPTLRNVPLWPGFCSYLEDLIDIQHSQRVLQTGGDTLIYGPLLETFKQQQKLRPYYDFLDVDTIRCKLDGETTMLASAVREVPLVEPVPWLAWWGQRFMLFTHGLGLITAPVSAITKDGGPVFLSSGIPVASHVAQLQPANQRIYYGEGSGSMAYSNVDRMKELDYPTDEGRAVLELPETVPSGVRIDSLLKRLVFGYMSGQFFEVVFSDLIHGRTRVHYFRTPLERLEKVAPFLYWDTDPFAIPTADGIQWMANGLTWTDAYPYSQLQELGDKSDVRTATPRAHQPVRYVRDAVKATVDAYSGQIKLYKFAKGEPILETAAGIYPDLFTPAEEMPADVRAQLQYPVQLMHIQFDDQYILYQMSDTMTFFNMEDMWDDADEVLGPILDHGHAIRFSIEPFYCVLDTGDGVLPPAKERTQFSMAMVFTPEGALNLRAIPIVYQDGEDYGRIVCLHVPKGHFFPGPEQADAAIDQDPVIAQMFTWWTRRGIEVIRGHTTTLLVEGEVIYVEPVFLRSQQNPATQLKQVCVVFRGIAKMASSFEEALRAAVDALREKKES